MWLHAVFAGITLDKAFAEAVRNRWDVGCRYLVAVSGGRDSMVLLHFLREAGYRNLVVCHVNHGMCGEASAEDATFVQREAARFGCEAVSRTVDVTAFAAEKTFALETAARELCSIGLFRKWRRKRTVDRFFSPIMPMTGSRRC